MNLYIGGSNRRGNCYEIIKDLKTENDKVILLADKDIKYCLGCSACAKGLEQYCVIKDDMKEIYNEMANADNIIIVTPIYMNHITGILKNVIDRWNPYGTHPELLENKKIYLVFVGQMSEEDNKEITESMIQYFESLGEFMNFETIFLKYISSGDVETINNVKKNNNNYAEIIEQIKGQIK